MPRFIVKPNRYQDEYLMWSTVVDAPVSEIMTRDEMFDWLKTGHGLTPPNTDEEAEARLTRCDIEGSSLKERGWIDFGSTHSVRIENFHGVTIDGEAPHCDLAEIVRAMDRKDIPALQKMIKETHDDQ